MKVREKLRLLTLRIATPAILTAALSVTLFAVGERLTGRESKSELHTCLEKSSSLLYSVPCNTFCRVVKQKAEVYSFEVQGFYDAQSNSCACFFTGNNDVKK